MNAPGSTKAGGSRRTVAVFPNWQENPYLSQLARGVQPHGYRFQFLDRRWPLVPLLSTLHQAGLPDLVHLHWQHPYIHAHRTFGTPAKVVSLLADLVGLRAAGVPVVWTVHNVVDHERTAPWLERTVGAVVARLVDRVIVHCPRAREVVREGYWLPKRRRARIDVVPHPSYHGAYPPPIEREEARRRLGLHSDRFVFLHFGSFRTYKRVRLIVEQFAALSPEDATLVVAGWVGDRSYFESVAEAAAGYENITVEGRRIPDDEVPVYFAAADAFVYGAERVLVSGSVMLALTYGLPVVAPTVGCLPETLPEEGAVWYSAGDTAGLREALRAVRYRPAERARKANRERARALDPVVVGEKLAAIYDEVLNG